MPRKPRFSLAEVPCHVIQRGNNREPCFFVDLDYVYYLDCLKEASQKYGCAVHAYVLMTNHVHLLMTPRKRDGISRVMQSVGRRYVQYINFSYKRTGTLWEGRHKASLIDSEGYLLTCYRYLELNPVRAGLVDRPTDDPWSSYRAHAQGEADPIIDDHSEYLALGDTPESRQRAYRELFRHHVQETDLHAIRTTAQRGVPLGNDRFRESVERQLRRSISYRPRGRPRKEPIAENK